MAQIVASYNSETGELLVSVDGTKVEDVSCLTFERSCYDDGYCACLHTGKNENNYSTYTTRRYAKGLKDPQISNSGELAAEIMKLSERK